MNDTLEIRLGVGIGILRFGITRDEARRLLGDPDEKDEYAYIEEMDDRTERWEFHSRSLILHFDSEEKYRLGTLAIEHPDAHLEGITLINRTKEEVLRDLENLDLGPTESEDMSSQEMPESELVSFDQVSLNLWFVKNRLGQVQWNYFFDEAESPIWP